MDNVTENLGARIKELRVKNGLTQNKVAEALHVTPGYISNVENNRVAMSLRVLMYYAKLVGISLDALVGLVEPEEYSETAVNNELQEKVSRLTEDQKKNLIKTLDIWFENEIKA